MMINKTIIFSFDILFDYNSLLLSINNYNNNLDNK